MKRHYSDLFPWAVIYIPITWYSQMWGGKTIELNTENTLQYDNTTVNPNSLASNRCTTCKPRNRFLKLRPCSFNKFRMMRQNAILLYRNPKKLWIWIHGHKGATHWSGGILLSHSLSLRKIELVHKQRWVALLVTLKWKPINCTFWTILSWPSKGCQQITMEQQEGYKVVSSCNIFSKAMKKKRRNSKKKNTHVNDLLSEHKT
jgi:hypothetical protein